MHHFSNRIAHTTAFVTSADIKDHRDKCDANHFHQAGHSIQNVRVKGLWLLIHRHCQRQEGHGVVPD